MTASSYSARITRPWAGVSTLAQSMTSRRSFGLETRIAATAGVLCSQRARPVTGELVSASADDAVPRLTAAPAARATGAPRVFWYPCSTIRSSSDQPCDGPLGRPGAIPSVEDRDVQRAVGGPSARADRYSRPQSAAPCAGSSTAPTAGTRGELETGQGPTGSPALLAWELVPRHRVETPIWRFKRGGQETMDTA